MEPGVLTAKEEQVQAPSKAWPSIHSPHHPLLSQPPPLPSHLTGHSHQVCSNGGAVAIMEYLTGDGAGTSFLAHTSPHIVISEERAAAIKFLLIAMPEAKEGEADDKDDDVEEREEKEKAAAGGGKA